MRLTRRLADALRHPARLAGLLRRVVQVAFAGQLGPTLRRFRPRSATPDEYRAWLGARAVAAPAVQARFAVLLDAVHAADLGAMRAGLGAVAGHDVLARGPAGWTRADGSTAPSLDAALASSQATWLLWIVAPVVLRPDALQWIASGSAVPGACVVYADDDHVDALARPETPTLRPAWDPWQALEHDALGALLGVHRSLAAAVDAARGPAGRWRFLLDVAARRGDDAIVHVPAIVAHATHASSRDDVRPDVARDVVAAARARGFATVADAQARPWLRYVEPARAHVSVVVPTRDRPALLDRCLASVAATRGGRDVEIVVVDNGSTDPAVEAVLRAPRGLDVRVVRRPEAFNFPRMCNAGVDAARGDVVVLLNNDTVVAPGWLDELAALVAQPGVGAAGPLLVYPDGRLQSAGVLLGVNRTATSALAGFAPDDPAAVAWCAVRRRVSAVLGACIAVRRSVYQAVGGFDPSFAVSHNEVDFALRLAARGDATLFTPFARVVHQEGATRGFEVTAEERARLAAEERLFVERWGARLAACDPAYHPALAREGVPFALGAPDYDATPRTGWTGACATSSAAATASAR